MEKDIVKKEKKSFLNVKIPHTYIIIGIIVVFSMLLTWVVPAGQFERYEDEITGRMLVDPDSYHRVEQSPVNPFQMLVAIQEGMIESADIIFFIFFAYGFVYMLIKTGAFDASVGALLRKMNGKEKYLIPVFMLLFGVCGSTFGMFEETYGLLPAFIGIAIAIGYDGLVGGAIVVVGVATGFASATFNPFTIGVAQGVAELPLFSGWQFRILVFVGFMSLAIWYVMRYAAKVKENPTVSIVKDVKFGVTEGKSKEELINLSFTLKHKLIMSLFLVTIIMIIFGTLKLGWYINELAALFIIMMFITGLIGGFNFSDIASCFVEAVSDVVFGALVIGIARAVLLVMEQGYIIDTIVYSLANLVSSFSRYTAGISMLIIQNLINFFIPSGSGQAATSMPIMAPLSDMIGISRQSAVLAFQFGDGFSNMFWPTAVATECGLMGLPIEKWYKFITPLFLMMLGLEALFIVLSIAINIGPF